jgi:hypothetical protein
MMVLRISLLSIIICLAGCAGKKADYRAETDQSAAEMFYREQETKKKRQECAGTTVRHQKEIDVEHVEIDRIDYDYVWTIDIPIPLDAIEKRNYCQAMPDVYVVGYTTSEAQEDLIDFYKQQMELLGWYCWWDTEGLEALLMFEKAHKHCAVSLRPSSSKRKTDIIIMQKTV